MPVRCGCGGGVVPDVCVAHKLDRSPNGHAREATVHARVRGPARAAIDARAAVEHGGNRSAWARRALAYALLHMPKDWTP